MGEVVGVLLAAGNSRRFGTDKRIQPLADGTPMALAAARNLAGACPRTLVVLRPEDTELVHLLTRAGFETVVCDSAANGMGHSLACGVVASAEASGWLVALADMPYIRPETYRQVIEALQDGAAIARPTFGEAPGHPVGFSAMFFSRLAALTGDQGGKAILAENHTAVRPCAVEDPGVVKDIDRPAQLLEADMPPPAQAG